MVTEASAAQNWVVRDAGPVPMHAHDGGIDPPRQKVVATRPSALADVAEESTQRRIVPSYTSAP
jgi:hypothetical protein